MRGRIRRGGVAVMAVAGMLAAGVATLAATPAQASTKTYAGTVSTGGMPLNVRSGPSVAATKVSALPHGNRMRISCQQPGQRIVGTVRTTKLWNRLPDGSFVSDAYVKRGATAPPRCAKLATAPKAGPTAGTWVMPVPATAGSGFRTASRPTHDGVDFMVAKGTPILSASAGTVIRVVCNASTGNCDVDGSPKVKGCGWYVEVAHADEVVTRYCHMVRKPPVQVGETVKAGQVIGHAGSSGNSSGPHLHFEVHVGAPPAMSATAVDPVPFLRARNVPIG